MEKTNYIQPTFIDNGTVNWKPVSSAFIQIQKIVNEHAEELKGIVEHNTFTISFGIEKEGMTTFLNRSKHLRVKIVNAYAVVGDNLKKENIVTVTGITNSIKFSPSHSAGNMRMFQILKPQLHFIDEVIVTTSSDRRIIVTMTFESTEA